MLSDFAPQLLRSVAPCLRLALMACLGGGAAAASSEQNHWSFVRPVRPAAPPLPADGWGKNAIDAFIAARLGQAGFKPSPEADRATLIRRVTLDLTGLPPTIDEVDAFLGDSTPQAFERVVDRLLESPRYGERMAQNWLDAARFADTNGYHFDGVRFLWLWRDWVINAFNSNLPYDRFTLEQIAGDLLPKATPDQRIATGFLRNNMTNDEGGADPDEYLNKYVVDRVSTVGTVWLGLTVGCAECHDHKYDPLTTKEFYQLYAFFNNVPEKGLDRIRTDNPPPRLPMPTPEQARQLVEAEFRVRDAEKTLQDRTNELGETQEKWERTIAARPPPPVAQTNLAGIISFSGTLLGTFGGTEIEGRFTGGGKPQFVTGRLGQALKFDGTGATEFSAGPAWDRANAFSIAAWVRIDGDGALVSRIEKSPGYRGVDLLSSGKKLEMHLISEWPGNALKVRTKDAVEQGKWIHVVAAYDGSGKAASVQIHVDGTRRELEVEKDQLTGPFASAEPLRIGARNGEAFLSGQLDDVRLYDRALSAEEIRQLAFEGYAAIVAKSRGNRTDEERAELAQFYKQTFAVDYLRSDAALVKARKGKETLISQIPTSLVMEEMDPPRTTHLLVRGDYRDPGEVVTAGTPAFLPPLPTPSKNRLHLARWLVSAENPLVARVTVNRFWTMLFGTGLVKTANDFGAQGERPSHPELLDWLACEFRDGSATPVSWSKPWDVKSLIRLIVTSAAYRQSAAVTPAMLEKDVDNRLLTRGPRVRLDAEFIRDQALAVSGLMNHKVGGPSVKPYQPPGLWDGTDSVFVQDHGDLLYRRGLYVFWRRSAHYPAFATFDAPNREVCTLMRQRTQTPLQSLVLMNDPAFVEAARGLAQRVTHEEPADLVLRLVRAFRHTLGRAPANDELTVLRKTYDHQLAAFKAEPKAAENLLKVGEAKPLESSPQAELAAMTAVANVLLNLNETITK
jgi:Protein of unknown function (DUF1553)/Protein of unknown function (DUF1549)/Concanavalin A-like lectin/glucanases superfamily